MIVQRRLAGKPVLTPLEIIRRAQTGTLIDEDGNVVTLELFPGLSNTELQDFANRVPCRIPSEIAELLGACRGFHGTVEQVDFSGRDLMFEPPHQSLIDDVHEDRLAHVWRTNPGVLSHEQCLLSEDPVLSAFAGELDESFQTIDLRLAKPGDGFSWGRYGPKTQIRRFGTHAVFAYKKPKSLISRLLGRAR
jgi:hypothetical protein